MTTPPNRPNSGVMGLHNQSPTTGHFKPAVHLGDRVKAGDLLGTVCVKRILCLLTVRISRQES